MYDQYTQIHLDIGDVVSGRESSVIFAKVLKVRYTDSFVILEVANVERVENGSAMTRLNIEDIKAGQVIRRKRDIVNTQISDSYVESVQKGVSFIARCIQI